MEFKKQSIDQQAICSMIEHFYDNAPIKDFSFKFGSDEDGPTLEGCTFGFKDDSNNLIGKTEIGEAELKGIIRRELWDQGIRTQDALDIGFSVNEGPDGEPVFENCVFYAQASVADIQKKNCQKQLEDLNDNELLEAVQAHFKSHPTLPGEKALKQFANDMLKNTQDAPVTLDAAQRETTVDGYLNTRIREISMEGNVNQELGSGLYDMEPIGENTKNGLIYMMDAEIRKSPEGVCVAANRTDGAEQVIGRLGGKELMKNPMGVDSCKAKLQVTDYSNGKLKNLSVRLVADTDLMSGDVIDLTNDMLSGLEESRAAQL